jgi:hypothetical protein
MGVPAEGFASIVPHMGRHDSPEADNPVRSLPLAFAKVRTGVAVDESLEKSVEACAGKPEWADG